MTAFSIVKFEDVTRLPVPSQTPDSELASSLATLISSWFVRRDGKFYEINNLGATLAKPDVQRICLTRLKQQVSLELLSHDLLKEVFARAIESRNASETQSIPVWSGKRICKPDNERRIVWESGLVAVNTWVKPAYRDVPAQPSLGVFGEFLNVMLPREAERAMFLNWLAWCLQNEKDKPSWAPFFYSRTKGSGKSTLCQAIVRLFGEDNSVTQNSVDKLTARFNMTLLQSKLVVCEELNLRPDSSQGNTLKTYITERYTLSEQKGREAERVEQFCCFLFTSNHLPLWIEAEDRRYYVIEVDHDGHASGPRADEFASLVGQVHDFLADDANVAAIYRYLMDFPLPEAFSAKTLNLSRDATDLMKQIQGASRQTTLELLEEVLNVRKLNAIPEAELAELAQEQLRINPNSIRHLMSELRWTKAKVKWGGVDYARALWVRQDHLVSNGLVYGPDGSSSSITVARSDSLGWRYNDGIQ